MRATRLAILIAVLSVVGGTGFFVHGKQLERLARSELEKAELAEKENDFAKAEKLYWEHLEVFPEDVDVQIKYANALLMVDKSPKRQDEAIQIYNDIVRRDVGREDARRRLMQLKIDRGQFTSSPRGGGADLDLQILLKIEKNKNDGNLLFLQGRCYEAAENYKDAENSYKKAIEHKAPQRIEAYQRRAILLRDKLNQPEKAEQIIKTMVQSDPENYQVYLARGRYQLSHPDPDGSRRKSLWEVARSDFQQALRRAPAEPDIYLEIARTFEDDKSGRNEVRQILEKGLKNAPTSVKLYGALARIEQRDGQDDKAIKTLENGVTKVPEPSHLHAILAQILAQPGGDPDKLRLQIEKLENIGGLSLDVKYFKACYYLKNNDFLKARQYLLQLQGARNLNPGFKAPVNMLLAQCYRQLGDSEMEQDAIRRALIANPEDATAKRGLIENLVNQGAIEEAIKECQALVKRVPEVRLRLAQLLIARNRRRPESKRDWSEVKQLINDAAKAAPESVEPVILEADLLLAQDRADEARNMLEKARSGFPKSESGKLWIAQARLIGLQGQVDAALTVLDGAQRQLGDQVELRLARAHLWATQKGPQAAKVLNDLAQNIEPFSKDERRRLLRGLADELKRQQDLQGASRLLSQLAEENPNDLELRHTLLDLAFQTEDKDEKDKDEVAKKNEIEKNIKEIERIEGSEGLRGRYFQVRYLIWQAKRARDKDTQEALRTRARVLLNELISRRGDWSVIPLALAQLEEQELAQGGLNEGERRAKEESIVNFYLQAIKLGQRDPAVVRLAVQLLFKLGRGSDAIELLKRNPVASQLAGDLERQAERFAFERRDYKRAEQIARKAVADNPGDFQEQYRLVLILLSSGDQAAAETALREAVDFSKSDPDRWITLVGFMVFTKQPEKAEQAIRSAEANLPQSQAPLALAQCCELIGQSYEAGKTDGAMKKWYAEAKTWYEKAQYAKPDDLSIKRRLTEFFFKTKQMSEAKSQLDAILKQGGGAKTTDTIAWANRTRALVDAYDADYQQVRKALSYFEPPGQPAASGQEGKTLKDPEDLRILTRVLDLQRTPQHRKRAIEILESLTDKKLANTEDQFLLARLYEKSDDWPKAREKYRELNLRTKNPRDQETLNRRPIYLAQYANSLLEHHQPGDEQQLAEAQNLVDEFKLLQPDSLETLILEVKLNRVRNRLEESRKLIKAFADRPHLIPAVQATLANLADELGQFKLAERLYRQLAALPTDSRGKIMLALFLGRHGHTKDALDICEPLWANPGDIQGVVETCIDVLLVSSKSEPDPVQLDRVSGWLEQALKQKPELTLLLVALANLRGRQERYQEAEDLYRRAIEQGDRSGVSHNNLAMLMAVKDGKGGEALSYIDRAIDLKGPKPDFLDTRGVVYLTAGDSQHAIDDLEKAIEVAPSPAKYFHLAQAYLGAKNKEKAKQSLAAAKIKRWEESGLEPLEKRAYQKVLTELGAP